MSRIRVCRAPDQLLSYVHALLFAGVAELSKHCTDLMELDLSGCWQISNKSLYALQENLVHMRGESPSSFHLTVGGTVPP